jgi:predicted CXXCH cytochrome family protein
MTQSLHNRHTLLAALGLALTAAAILEPVHRSVLAAQTPAPSNFQLQNPDATCAECHQQIYERFRTTAKARGSGDALQALLPGTFHHDPSNISYRVYQQDGSAWMSYSRPASDPRGPLDGHQQLRFYIGSGHRGRTYLCQSGSQWFELPINYYTRRASWDMAPAFGDSIILPAPLPVDPNCLHCHATAVQPSLSTARNSFATIPFLQGGVGCSSCHGDPSAHLASRGHGPIANPAKMPPSARDSVCLQCHLEGDAVVYRPGKSLNQFTVGDDLAQTAVYFVRSTGKAGGGRATSQYEALLQSACKRASGDKLTCITCHDPHGTPAPDQRVAFYRARCLQCHTAPAMANHHPEQPDCTHCHMPRLNTADISHEQLTDHNIQAKPHPLRDSMPIPQAIETLVPVGNTSFTDRELGLAYAQLAEHGFPGMDSKALQLLANAAATGASDPELNSRLGYLYQLSGKNDLARQFYRKALEADPYQPSALANLAVIDAATGRVPEAVRLLDRLVSADPSRTPAGLNLAFIECSLGRTADSRALLEKLAQLNPDDPQLRTFLDKGTYAGRNCLAQPLPTPGNPSE